LLVVIELALRLASPSGVLTEGDDRALDYRGIAPELAAYGAPALAVIGSSRARRGVLAPLLRSLLAQQGIRVRVGNFALGGAQAEEIELVVRRLTEVKKPPKLMVWPITAREFETRDQYPSNNVRYLWRPNDWWTGRATSGHAADRHLPDALRNELARSSWVLRYRFALKDMLQDPPREGLLAAMREVIAPRERRNTPLHGGVHRSHLGPSRNRSRPLEMADVKKYVGDEYREPEWPRNYQATHLESSIRRAHAAGIDILFVEVPPHRMLDAAMPPRTTEKFRAYMLSVAARFGSTFVPAPELGVAFEPRDFAEQSHLNYRGAEKYTRALAPLVQNAWNHRALRPPAEKR
jgi:hypothetical protein